MAIEKINTIAYADLAKINSVDKADIAKVYASDVPSTGATFADDYSLEFDGSNDYVNAQDFTFSNENITWSFWAQRGSTANGKTMLGSSVDVLHGMWFRTNSDTGFGWFFGEVVEGSYWGSNSGDVGFSNGSGWHHIAMTITVGAEGAGSYIGGTVKAYFDGSECFSGVISTVIGDEVPLLLNIGGSPSTGGASWTAKYFPGHINDVAVWNDVLTAGEITAIYNGGDPTDLRVDSGDYASSSNLAGYWWMGDGDTFATITDHSDDGNDGTMTNMTSGDIVSDVPVAASFTDNKCIDGMDSLSKYLSSTSNLPSIFTGASQQSWTIVWRFYHNATGNKGIFHWTFSGSSIYIYLQNFGETLFWMFWGGQSGTAHMPMYTTGDDVGDRNVTMTITKDGDTLEDMKLYVNGGSAHVTGQNPTDTIPLITSAMTAFKLGLREGVFNFGGNKFNDFALFDAAFTEAEATEAYNSGTTMDLRTHSRAGDLQHYWLMGDGDDGAGSDDDGSTIYDIVGDCDLDMTGMDADDIVDF
jgi:hypothetical protein